MSTARKVLEWDGADTGELARELRELPPGRYVLVPENELTADDALSADEDAELLAALEEGEHGEGAPAAQVLAEMRALLAEPRR